MQSGERRSRLAEKIWPGALLFALFIIISVIAACSSGNSSNSRSGPQQGILGVSLTDAPACGFDAVNVTVSRVRVHRSASASENDAGWSDIILDPARKINLLDLTNGVLEDLGQTPLAAGHYTQLRLVLSASTGTGIANSVVPSGTDTEIPLVTPSALQSGIKLINEFDVSAGQRVDLVLDFDACKSVVVRGNGTYLLKPVIKVSPLVQNGISGFVDTALLGSNVVVSAQTGSTVVRSTAPSMQTGEFFLAQLGPGDYNVVVTADNHVTAVIAGVPISGPTGTAAVSTSASPITMPTSTVHTLSGTVTLSPPADEVADVITRQTVTAGLTVAVKSQVIDPLSGSYSLTLPTGSPLLGFYGAGTLPIALSEEPGAAGKYETEASAAGYQTQSVDIDISTTDVTQDFVLVP